MRFPGRRGPLVVSDEDAPGHVARAAKRSQWPTLEEIQVVQAQAIRDMGGSGDDRHPVSCNDDGIWVTSKGQV